MAEKLAYDTRKRRREKDEPSSTRPKFMGGTIFAMLSLVWSYDRCWVVAIENVVFLAFATQVFPLTDINNLVTWSYGSAQWTACSIFHFYLHANRVWGQTDVWAFDSALTGQIDINFTSVQWNVNITSASKCQTDAWVAWHQKTDIHIDPTIILIWVLTSNWCCIWIHPSFNWLINQIHIRQADNAPEGALGLGVEIGWFNSICSLPTSCSMWASRSSNIRLGSVSLGGRTSRIRWGLWSESKLITKCSSSTWSTPGAISEVIWRSCLGGRRLRTGQLPFRQSCSTAKRKCTAVMGSQH